MTNQLEWVSFFFKQKIYYNPVLDRISSSNVINDFKIKENNKQNLNKFDNKWWFLHTFHTLEDQLSSLQTPGNGHLLYRRGKERKDVRDWDNI